MLKHSLINLKERLPETVEDFFAPWNEWFGRNGLFQRTTLPALNVSEDKDHFSVTVAAPGLEKSDFDIDVEDNVLTISAASEKEHEEERKKYRRREYSYSGFSRSFTLPANVQTDAIEARYEKGILSLMLPKHEQSGNSAEQKITVK